MSHGEHIWKDVLLFIFDEQGRATAKAIQREFKITPVQSARVTHGLRKKGWIVGGNGGNIRITDFGKDKLVQVFPQVMSRMFGEQRPESIIRTKEQIEKLNPKFMQEYPATFKEAEEAGKEESPFYAEFKGEGGKRVFSDLVGGRYQQPAQSKDWQLHHIAFLEEIVRELVKARQV